MDWPIGVCAIASQMSKPPTSASRHTITTKIGYRPCCLMVKVREEERYGDKASIATTRGEQRRIGLAIGITRMTARFPASRQWTRSADSLLIKPVSLGVSVALS